MGKRLAITVAGLLLIGSAAHAVITFEQLDDDVFVVSHVVKGLGRRAKAMKEVYSKSASLCVAAGFEYYKILDQESQAPGYYEQANASVQVKFFFEDAEDRIECKRGSVPEYVDQAKKKLAKKGYKAPEPPITTEEDPD